MDSGPVVLFQPQNHVGLGHISRLSAIALALRRLDPRIATPFVVEGAAHVLLDALGLAYLPLPSCHQMDVVEGWSAFSASLRSSLVRETSQAILNNLKPRIVVFDCFPNIEFSAAVLESKDKPAIVLCLREVKDWQSYLPRLTGLLDHVTQILIPHDSTAFGVPEIIREKSLFVGEIVRPAFPASQTARNRRRIVINAGGGGHPDAVDFYNLALRAIDELRKTHPDVEPYLIAGPLFNDWSRLRLTDGVTLIPFVASMPAAFSSAGLVVSQAGYNTVCELREVNVAAIFVPGVRTWDDQFARASKLASRYPHFQLFAGTNHSELAHMMSAGLQASVLSTGHATPPGAQRAAEYLRSLLF